jgi:SIR2-like domain
MAGEARERILEWLTSSDTCFLVGAGCSRCAGKPLIDELTGNILAKVDGAIKTQFEGLKGIGSRAPTVEDLITYLIRYQSILQTENDPTTHTLKPDWIEASLQSIKREIVEQIADKWVASPVHARFLRRIGGAPSKWGRDVFSLNYDTVIEATLDHLRVHYIDGFRGTRLGWFDPTVFEETPESSPSFRIYKLHGSINWLRDKSGHVRRAIVNSAADITDPVVVFPSEQKYLQTQFGVYETLINRFRQRLRVAGVNNRLVVLGYSFNDEHINEAIVDAMGSPGTNLTVIAFVGPDANADVQKKRLQEFAARCDHRFNAYVGDAFHIGGALDETESKVVLGEELWRFEKLVDYIAGAAA